MLINRGAEDMSYRGQAIGMGTGVIDSWDSADIAKKVTIEAGGAGATGDASASAASATSTVHSSHGSVASAKLTPATSDNTSGVAAFVVVAASAVLGGIALRLSKQR